jgi:hypothetical protein
MQTKDAFVNDDNFDPEEAIQAAVDKRKFLIKKLLKDYPFTEDSDREYISYREVTVVATVLCACSASY